MTSAHFDKDDRKLYVIVIVIVSFPVVQKVGNVDIFALLCSER